MEIQDELTAGSGRGKTDLGEGGPWRDLDQIEIIYDSAHVALCVFDANLRFVRVNRRMAEINGVPAAEHLGRTPREVVPDLAPQAEAILKQILATGEPVLDVEVSGTTKSQPGVPRTWIEQWLPLRDAEGRVIGVNVAAEEVTHQRAAERALQESEFCHRQMVDSLPVLVWTCRPDGYCDFVSRQWEDYTGVAAHEQLGDGWSAVLHPDDRQRTIDAWRMAVEGRDEYCHEYRIRRHDGEYHWFKTQGRPIRDAAGHITRWFGTCADIHDQKLAEAGLKALNETLEERVSQRAAEAEQKAAQLRMLALELTRAEQRQRRRLAQILHDHLQQLLVGARMKLGLLGRRLSDERLARCVKEVDRLLDESIAESRSLTVELSPPILYDAGLRGGLEWLARQMDQKHHLAVEVCADPRAEPADEGLRVFLFQAVRELLFNVVKHARVDRAYVRSQVVDRTIRIEVADDGDGFKATGEHRRRPLGGGFGLFSIEERLKLLGGRLEVSSASGKGTRVVMEVPDEQPMIEAIEPALSPLPSTGTGLTEPATPAASRRRVLVADDHPIVRKGLADLLREQPEIELVGEARDGVEAVEMARQLQPDVVVIDVCMPRLNGIEATRRLLAERPGMRVIGLSMHQEEDMARAMREAGAVAYLSKDTPADVLIPSILNSQPE